MDFDFDGDNIGISVVIILIIAGIILGLTGNLNGKSCKYYPDDEDCQHSIWDTEI